MTLNSLDAPRLFLLAASTASVAPVSAGDAHARGAECEPEVVVTQAADAGPGSLREAIASLCPFGTIGFAQRFEIALASEIVVDQALSIDAGTIAGEPADEPGDRVRILGGPTHRIFHVTATGDLGLRRVRLSDGNANASGSGAGTGGAILNFGRLSVSESRFDGNSNSVSTSLGGGAIFNGTDAEMQVDASLFDGNQGGRGSAIFNAGHAELRNSTFTGNVPNGSITEGAIQNRGTLLGIHLTIAGNGLAGDSIGGLFAFNADTTLVNSIVADNFGNNCNFGGGSFTAIALLSESGSCPRTTNQDPGLLALENRGGPTATIAIAETSPAFDAGDPALCLETDQRGHVRPQNGACDLGAFELALDLFTDGFESSATGTSGGGTRTRLR
jgi:hypothetical protein